MNNYLTKIVSFYDTIAPYYNSLLNKKIITNRNFKDSWIIKEINGLQMQDLIIDCGCGTGIDVLSLRKFDYNAIGCDISNKMLKEAQKMPTTINSKSLFFKHNLREKFDTKYKNTFSCALCAGNVLLHFASLKEIKNVLKNIFDILIAGGILLVEIDDLHSMIFNKHYLYHAEGVMKHNKKLITAIDFWNVIGKNLISTIFLFQNINKKWSLMDNIALPLKIIELEKLQELCTDVGFKDVSLKRKKEQHNPIFSLLDHTTIKRETVLFKLTK